jgi:hypothetical protein
MPIGASDVRSQNSVFINLVSVSVSALSFRLGRRAADDVLPLPLPGDEAGRMRLSGQTIPHCEFVKILQAKADSAQADWSDVSRREHST